MKSTSKKNALLNSIEYNLLKGKRPHHALLRKLDETPEHDIPYYREMYKSSYPNVFTLLEDSSYRRKLHDRHPFTKHYPKLIYLELQFGKESFEYKFEAIVPLEVLIGMINKEYVFLSKNETSFYQLSRGRIKAIFQQNCLTSAESIGLFFKSLIHILSLVVVHQSMTTLFVNEVKIIENCFAANDVWVVPSKFDEDHPRAFIFEEDEEGKVYQFPATQPKGLIDFEQIYQPFFHSMDFIGVDACIPTVIKQADRLKDMEEIISEFDLRPTGLTIPLKQVTSLLNPSALEFILFSSDHSTYAEGELSGKVLRELVSKLPYKQFTSGIYPHIRKHREGLETQYIRMVRSLDVI